MYTITALVFCVLLGVMVRVQGWSALLWFPLGFVVSIFVTAQMVLPLLLGVPRAIRLVSTHEMRAAVFGRILLTPLIWIVLIFGVLFAIGFLSPSSADFLYNNMALNVGMWLGTIAIVLSPLSAKSRADFRADFDESYGRFYTNNDGSLPPNIPGTTKTLAFRCLSCDQQLTASEEASVVTCSTCNQTTPVPITIDRANEIVDRISQLLMDGGLCDYTPLSLVGASSRLECMHALYVATAQTFQVASLNKSPRNQRVLDDFLGAAGGTGMRMALYLMPDAELAAISKMPDPWETKHDWSSLPADELKHLSRQMSERNAESERLQGLAQSDAVFTQSETIDSFVSFLRDLNPAEENYWPLVYRRIGLPCPV